MESVIKARRVKKREVRREYNKQGAVLFGNIVCNEPALTATSRAYQTSHNHQAVTLLVFSTFIKPRSSLSFKSVS